LIQVDAYDNLMNFVALQAEILNMEKTIAKYRRELQAWLNFKQNGSVEKAKQIELLEKELRDMQESYEEMSGMFYIT